MPLNGGLDVTTAKSVANMPDLATEALELKAAEVLQIMFEIDAEPMLDLLPAALHPTIPPTVTFVFYKLGDSPIGGFTFAQVRVGSRAGARPRGYLVGACIDNPEAGEALTRRWGYNCREAEVSLTREYHRIEGFVRVNGTAILEVTLEDPEPISGADIQYVANMHLADVSRGGETQRLLVQVDPEFVIHKADRGRPQLKSFDAAAWGDARIDPAYPVSASYSRSDIEMPRIRYVCKPGVPAMQGTEKVG